MKRKELESVVEELTNKVELLEHFKESTIDWVTDLSRYLEINYIDLKKYTISKRFVKPAPEESYLSLQDKKIIEETRKVQIANDKELNNLVERKMVQELVLKISTAAAETITDEDILNKFISRLNTIFDES